MDEAMTSFPRSCSSCERSLVSSSPGASTVSSPQAITRGERIKTPKMHASFVCFNALSLRPVTKTEFDNEAWRVSGQRPWQLTSLSRLNDGFFYKL